MRDPLITQRVLTAIDRSVDPYIHIDRLRRAVADQYDTIEAMDKDIQLLKLAEQKRVTETGVWKIVKGKLEEETIDWVKWAIRGTVGALGVSALGGLVWILKLAWKGLTT